MFQHTAARRRLVGENFIVFSFLSVSTHSRPKAAGEAAWYLLDTSRARFNTQPPEGGWPYPMPPITVAVSFQHTAARRRLAISSAVKPKSDMFQHTAARRRLVNVMSNVLNIANVSTHSRPKAAGLGRFNHAKSHTVSTHSRPKAAGRMKSSSSNRLTRFNTQPPEGGWQFLQP